MEPPQLQGLSTTMKMSVIDTNIDLVADIEVRVVTVLYNIM